MFGALLANKSRILFLLTGVYTACLLSVGGFGIYTISMQNKVTVATITRSRARADAASQTLRAILTMGKAQAQLLAAADAPERRTSALLAIRSLSTLDENIQQLQQALPGSPKVAELGKLVAEIAPAKLEV